MSEQEKTLDTYLNGIAELRNGLREERRVMQEQIEHSTNRLKTIDAELERIDAILGNGANSEKKSKERASRASKRVLKVIMDQFKEHENDFYGLPIPDENLILCVKEVHPDLTDESILSAVRRLARGGKIVRGGSRGARHSRPRVVTEKTTKDDDSAITTPTDTSSGMRTVDNSNSTTMPILAFDKVQQELVENRRKDPDKVLPIGTPLFDGMEPPK